MQKINPQVVRIGLIGLGTALLIYALKVAENTNTDFSKNNLQDGQNEKPSAYLTQSTFNMFNNDGKLSKLYVEKAFIYNNKDSITIVAPKFTTNSFTSGMRLTADNGFYNPKAETLFLDGNVIARKTDQDGSSWILNSEKLDVDNKLGTLSTSEEVNISSGTNSIRAIGFEGSIIKREIKLLSKVRGQYVFEN
jgi:LPS export ABC transporter protein LptC